MGGGIATHALGLLEVQSLCWLEQLSPVAAGVLCAVQLLVPVKGDEAARCCCYHAPVLDAAVGAGVLDGDGGGGAGAAAAAVPHRLAPEQFDAGFPVKDRAELISRTGKCNST